MLRRCFYALGGGLGHLTRALSLARRLAADGESQNLIITNSPFARAVLNSDFPISDAIRYEVLPAGLSNAGLRQKVPALIRRFSPDVLVVDTFPRGLMGELVDLIQAEGQRQVFVHRDLSSEYVRRFDLEAFVGHYHLILVPGESAPLEDEPNAIRTAPWLLLDENE